MISPSAISLRQYKAKDTPLDPEFQLGQYDVLCTRGKSAFNHSGNVRFRSIIESHFEEYGQCQTKLEKSLAVITIVEEVRKLSPEGGFVKFCKAKNCYVEVGDIKAREKIGHALRELKSNCRKSKGHSVTKKAATKKSTHACLSVAEMFASTYDDQHRESSELLPKEECAEDLCIDNLLLEELADNILMESCDFDELWSDSDESFLGIFDS